MASSQVGRRIALATTSAAAIVTLMLLAAPSVGLIGGGSAPESSKDALIRSLFAGESTPAAMTPSAPPVDTEPVRSGPPHPVGSLTTTVVDTSRPTPARGATPETDFRSIAVTIYYPTTEALLLGAQFPLVVFVHGYGSSAATFDAMEQEIAAAGFVVAAPDFPLSSSALDGEAVRDIVSQATDVSFVITSLLDPSSRPLPLAGLIADSKIAVIGHSDGAVTAAGVAYNDEYADRRVGAAVILSGAEAFFPGAWFDVSAPALLAIHGTADEVNPFGASQTLFSDATGPKWLVGVTNGSHLAPFTNEPALSEISTLVADFLRAELSGDTTALKRVDADASTSELALVSEG